jgi:hypothetical protein
VRRDTGLFVRIEQLSLATRRLFDEEAPVMAGSWRGGAWKLEDEEASRRRVREAASALHQPSE